MARPPRLDRSKYLGEISVACVACVDGRYPVFVDQDEFVLACVAKLRDLAAQFKVNVPIFCFMPDHIHILIQGYDGDSDALTCMERFRQYLGFEVYKRKLPPFQPGFYDHIIRASEDWRNQARYIAFNPVRGGLVESWTSYRYVGSLHGDVRDLFP